MNFELLFYVLLNLSIVFFGVVISYKIFHYHRAWYLRVQRAEKIKKDFYGKMTWLKITLPKEVNKSPAAMEVVLLTLYQGLGHKPNTAFPDRKEGEERWKWKDRQKEEYFLKYTSGSMRMWSSLEIFSEEGKINYYVMTQPKNVQIFKQYAYSQFPGVEITESEDPTKKYSYLGKDKKLNLYVGRYKLGEADAFPIKTYIDYGLDKDPKEEYKLDPLTTLLEGMSTAKKGEAFWYQVLVRPTIYNKDNHYDWQKETQNKIDEILSTKVEEVEDPHHHGEKVKKYSKDKKLLDLTPAEKDKVDALQRNMQKDGWDVVIRFFYIVDTSITPFDLNRGVFTVVNAMKPFNKPGYNKFDFNTLTVDTDTPFKDRFGIKSEGTRGWVWKMAKLRAAYYHEAVGIEFNWDEIKGIWKKWRKIGWWAASEQIDELKEYWSMVGDYPHKGGTGEFVLNTEELVTLWHFPGKTFSNDEAKVSSSKASPPPNLPM